MIGDLGFDLTQGALGEKDARDAALAGVARCVLSQIERPYPCAERQTLVREEDLELPRLRYPVFYGSFDWHSCVHSHWTLVRLLADGCLVGADDGQGGDLEEAAAAQLSRSLTADGIAAEAASWRDHIAAHEEKPYGWTWLLALDSELARLASMQGNVHAAEATGWRDALKPLVAEMRRRVDGWLGSISMAARTGTHSDTAWNLAMAHDYATATNDAQLKDAVEANARRLYARDVNAPVAFEPNADTFTSAILNEAACMARALSADEYETWLSGFFPQLFDGSFASPLVPDLPGRWNGEGYLEVHQVALPTARGIACRDAAAPLAAGAARDALVAEARRWVADGVQDVQMSGYLADHWVGSFVCAALCD